VYSRDISEYIPSASAQDGPKNSANNVIKPKFPVAENGGEERENKKEYLVTVCLLYQETSFL
jgi:hypothetical protein